MIEIVNMTLLTMTLTPTEHSGVLAKLSMVVFNTACRLGAIWLTIITVRHALAWGF